MMWIGAFRLQATTWTNAKSNLHCPVVFSGHNESSSHLNLMTSCCINFAILSNGFTSPFGKKEKKNCHLYNTILSLYISYQVSTYHIKTLQEESAKKSNIPWIWRIIYGHKLPYMKKTKITLYEEDKKEEASMRCSLLHGSWDQILRRCPSVRLSVRPSGEVSGHLPENAWREWPEI